MAAEPTLGHPRTDSGVGGIDSISKTIFTAQSFCTAVSSFASDNGFQALNELLNLLPQLKDEIQARDGTIRDLEAKLAAQEKSHSDYTREQLLGFEDRYDEWNEENDTLQSKVEELKEASKKKDSKMAELRGELEVKEARVGDLEREHTQITKRLKERNQQIGELEARLQKTHVEADDLKEELRKLHGQMAVLQKSFEEEVNKYQSLKDKATKTRERYRELVQFSVEIIELDMPAT
jgi:chromosome segregation ATPase